MAIYLANRINDGALDYLVVVTRRPDLKEIIDAELVKLGKFELIE